MLIFDEPTVGLDVLNALEMQKVIAEFRAEGKTIIFSTHIMSEAEKLCDRIAIIHRGRIHACDTLADLRDGHRQALPRGHLRALRRTRPATPAQTAPAHERLNWHVVVTLFRTEMRMVLRDRRILVTSIVLPLLVTPLLLLASTWSVKKREQTLQKTSARYAVTGSESNAVRAADRGRAQIAARPLTPMNLPARASTSPRCPPLSRSLRCTAGTSNWCSKG